jgi:hypothetical protein
MEDLYENRDKTFGFYKIVSISWAAVTILEEECAMWRKCYLILIIVNQGGQQKLSRLEHSPSVAITPSTTSAQQVPEKSHGQQLSNFTLRLTKSLGN